MLSLDLLYLGFRGSHLLLLHLVWFCGQGTSFLVRTPQVVSLTMHKMVFQLSNMVVGLHLNNSTGKAYLCNYSGTASPFLSELACHIFNLANKHSITLIPAYIPTHLNVEANYLFWGLLVPEWHLLSHIA